MAAISWTWINPRLFSEPKVLTSWASEGVMGEQVFLDRKTTPVATYHVRAAHVLTGVSAFGVGPMIYGLGALNFWAVIVGLVVTMGAEIWFVDRMVWLYRATARN